MNPRNLFSCLLLLSTPLAAQQRFDAARWAHRATLETAGIGQSTRYAAFKLDAGVYRHTASSLGDLRIVSPSGLEAPYTFRQTDLRNSHRVELRPRTINRVATSGGALQFVLDFGAAKGSAHNSLRFAWTESGFRRPLRIESSADQRDWSLVKEAMLLDFRQDGLLYQTLRIDYPESTQRYLRLTISDWSDPATLVTVNSTREVSATKVFTELAAPAIRTAEPESGEGKGDRAFEFDLPFRMPSPVRFDFSIEGGEFVRAVEVKTKSDGRPWPVVCHGTIARVDGDGMTFLECSPALRGTVRVVVRNRDNPAIRITGVKVRAEERSIIVSTAEPGSYSLFAGNPTASLPDYDLDEVLARSSGVVPAAASVGAWQPNPGYQPPPVPLSERGQAWLTPLLAVVALAIGAAAFLLIRKTKPAQ